MEYERKTKTELISICKSKNISGYSGKNKEQLIQLIITATKDVKLKMLDLFAGTGAFTKAFESTGKIECIFANDIVEWSKKIYDENFAHKLTLKDLNDIKVEDIPEHDILTAGFPCQPWSVAGKRGGFDDERTNSFWKILEIIDFHNPSCVVLENVKNIISHNDGKSFEIILKNFRDRGYYTHYKVLDTSEITGIPQHRERVYLVCFNNTCLNREKFSLEFEKKEKLSINALLLSSENIPDKYYYTNKSTTWDLIKDSVVKRDTVYQYRRVYVRENKSNECPTLTANMGGGGHNVPLILDDRGIRKFTPRECFNFQGFPQTYKFPKLSDTNLYKLAGNAVSLPVVELIANRVISYLTV